MRTPFQPGAMFRQGDASPDELRDADLPPPPSADAFVRPTRPGGADLYVRPTVPGVYPGVAREQALHAVFERETAVEVPRAAAPRSARPTEPMAAPFTPVAALPFAARAALPPAPIPPAPVSVPDASSTSLTPHSTSASRSRWSATSGSALPAVAPRRPYLLALGVVVSIAVGCLVAVIGRHVQPAPVTAVAPPTVTVTAPPSALPEAPAATPAPETAPAPTTAATPTAPRGKVKPKAPAPLGEAPARPAKPASPAKAPHRPFEVESD
jgi:hypothetical protein